MKSSGFLCFSLKVDDKAFGRSAECFVSFFMKMQVAHDCVSRPGILREGGGSDICDSSNEDDNNPRQPDFSCQHCIAEADGCTGKFNGHNSGIVERGSFSVWQGMGREVQNNDKDDDTHITP